MSGAQERFSNGFDGHAVLKCEARDDGAVLGGRVAMGARLRIAQKDFGEPPIGKSTDARTVTQPVALEVKRLAQAAIFEAFASTDPM